MNDFGAYSNSLDAGSGWEGQEEEEDARREETLSSGHRVVLVQPPFQRKGLKETLHAPYHSPPLYDKEMLSSWKRRGRVAKWCHTDNHSQLTRSSPTPQSKGRVQLPNPVNTHHYTQQHLISPSNICASNTETSRTGI